MITTLIECPYCGGASPADARYCIECSAPLLPTATYTTYHLAPPAQPFRPAPRPAHRRTVRISHILAGVAGATLLGGLLFLSVLADRNPQFDTAARLLLIIGGVQLARFVRRGQIIAGLRAAVICLALVLAVVTPWMLSVVVVAGAFLLALHMIEAYQSSRRAP